jgi:O-antigen/teichoic acid export membrane protein
MRLPRLRAIHRNVLLGNMAARVGGLGCVFATTLLLARNGGPAVVGVYALLHVLPGLVGTLSSSGLPVATPYFLAGADRDDRRLPSTLVAIALAGGVAGAALWIVSAPFVGPYVFPDLSTGLVMLAGVAVFTRLVVVTAKACSQGSEDLGGSNAVIFGEQFMFLPAYTLLWVAGVGGFGAVVGALLLADTVTGSLAWTRLARRGFFRSATTPSLPLARRIAGYGFRAQIGGVMSLLNLRLDFILLSVMAGPAVLGVYAVASKFAELIRIFGMALQYVSYPRFARVARERASENARRLIPRVALLSCACLVPLWLAAGILIPELYGSAFDSAVTPTRIILFGLALDGVAGVVSGFLYGVGRPGLNSVAMGAGLTVTVVLDLILIPPFGAIGAAIASAVAYTTTAVALLWFFWRVERTTDYAISEGPPALADAR